MRLPWTTTSSLMLGTFCFGLRTLRLPVDQARVHTHVLGKTGSGKSYFLAHLFLALQQAGLAATLLDPHGDLAELILTQLIAAGLRPDSGTRHRLLYLDLPAAETHGLFLPLNVLAQPYTDHAMAEHLAEACRRAWPELATGAPTFENILKHSVIALRQAGCPLTDLARLLTNRPFRETVLAQVTDPQVCRFFHDRLDAWGRDAAVMKESTLNRVDLLTLSPLLRAGLGAPDTAVNFRRLLDTGTSLIVNLALPSPDTRRLLGCLLTVGMEAAALSRADQPTAKRVPHYLLLDEFSQFMAQSEESLTRMLSETRKYNLFCVMAHQNWSQASDRLKGALQNVGLEVILKTGRADAEYSARLLGAVDPLSIKHTVTDETAVERTHPTFFPLSEQWETYIQQIQALRTGQAFIRLPNDTVRRVATPTLPAVTVPAGTLSAIRQHYLATYFRPLPLSRSAETPLPQARPQRGQAGPRLVAPAPLSRAPATSDGTSNIPVAFDGDVAPAPAQATDTPTTAEAEPHLTGSEQPISRHRPDEPTGQHPQPGRRR